MVRAYNFTIEYVLYDLSYANMIMYSAVIPSYKSRKDKKADEEEVIDANDPKNRERIDQLLDD